jgi:hypothetical protein
MSLAQTNAEPCNKKRAREDEQALEDEEIRLISESFFNPDYEPVTEDDMPPHNDQVPEENKENAVPPDGVKE